MPRRLLFIVVLLGAVMLFMAPPAGAQGEPPADGSVSAGDAYKNARPLFDQGEFQRALRWLEYAHRKKPRAAYVFAMGRAYEGMGRLQQAHDTYLLSRTQPGAKRAVVEQAENEAKRLAPLLGRAVLRLSKQPEGSIYQLDGALVADPTLDLVRDPGPHQLCLRPPAGDRLSCWKRELPAGRRLTWPPVSAKGLRGRIEWPQKDAPQLVSIDGVALFLDVRSMVSLGLAVGEHTLALTAGDSKREVTVRVLPDQAVALPGVASAKAPDPVKPLVPPPTLSTSAGAGPWILTGLGVTAAGVGVALMVIRGAEVDDFDLAKQDVDDHGVVQGITENEANATQDRINSLTTGGVVSLSIGGAAIASAIIWWALPRVSSTTATVVPLAGGGMLSVGAAF